MGLKVWQWSWPSLIFLIAGCGILSDRSVSQIDLWSATPPVVRDPSDTVAWPEVAFPAGTQFLVVAGGGAPGYNEIALEKNVRYFQRTLATLGYSPATAHVLFANGNNGQATVRYLDDAGQERFKVPEIPHILGAATPQNVRGWFNQLVEQPAPAEDCPIFFYFTGHGALNASNADNNAAILWGEQQLSVRDLAQQLDTLPTDQAFVTMMAQCYAGAFANLIYENGDPDQPVALQSRCGFFATVKTRPSVGCSALVNEADYRDYSSSFFAGFSGRDRLDQPVASADYDQNGTVSFAEAHSFAKVDLATSDWPIATSEAWLQRQASEADIAVILAAQPLADWLLQARPEQAYVVRSLAAQLGFTLQQSYTANLRVTSLDNEDEIVQAYATRLKMELINIAITARILDGNDPEKITVLKRLLNCEAGSWN